MRLGKPQPSIPITGIAACARFEGAEGGTGAAPAEYEDHVGTPLTEGLMMVHNALVGTGLRDRIKLGVSGKIATGSDIVKRLAALLELYQKNGRSVPR